MTQADNFKMISMELQCGAMCGKGGGGILPPYNWISKYLMIFFFTVATLSLYAVGEDESDMRFNYKKAALLITQWGAC